MELQLSRNSVRPDLFVRMSTANTYLSDKNTVLAVISTITKTNRHLERVINQ
jgi:hypothetical protein